MSTDNCFILRKYWAVLLGICNVWGDRHQSLNAHVFQLCDLLHQKNRILRRCSELQSSPAILHLDEDRNDNIFLLSLNIDFLGETVRYPTETINATLSPRYILPASLQMTDHMPPNIKRQSSSIF